MQNAKRRTATLAVRAASSGWRIKILAANISPFAAIFAMCVVSGCAFIPSSGPLTQDVAQKASIRVGTDSEHRSIAYAFVPLDGRTVVEMPPPNPEPRFARDFTNMPPASVTIGPGDVVNITIFESGGGGLFLPPETIGRQGNYVTMPPQQVDQLGRISVPYIGPLSVAGDTPVQVEHKIEKLLGRRALEPQVIVSLAEHHSSEIAVTGDATLSGPGAMMRFTLDPGGTRLTGALARTGGLKFQSFETLVTIQRGKRSESALLSEVEADPQQNIQIQPGDVILVRHRPKYFAAFGATGVSTTLAQPNRRFLFTDPTLTLADALALAGGVEDDRANPRGLFLYRMEKRSVLESLGVPDLKETSDTIPTVYSADLSDPVGFFLISQVSVHSEDVIFVSNAPAADLQKFLSLLGTATGSAASFHNAVR